MRHAVRERFAEAAAHIEKAKRAGIDHVAVARAKVSAEFAFIGYVEGIYLATQGGVHAEVGAAETPGEHAKSGS